jgi:hypothetical protein
LSSSAFTCRHCGQPLGRVKPSKVLHPNPVYSRLIFVDNEAGTSTFACKACGATIVFRGGRIDLDKERKTA